MLYKYQVIVFFFRLKLLAIVLHDIGVKQLHIDYKLINMIRPSYFAWVLKPKL